MGTHVYWHPRPPWRACPFSRDEAQAQALTMTAFKIISFLLMIASSSAAKCPDIIPYRSKFVQSSFDPSKLLGFWFEQAYIDIAQVGASCPTLNATFKGTTLDMAFKVDYGKMPFTIVEEYFATNTTGYFIKQAEMPGAGLLKLPTVVVDVTTSANGTQYDTMTLYSCTTKLGLEVPELVFASRVQTLDTAALARMQSTARAQGVQWDENKLKVVNRTTCN